MSAGGAAATSGAVFVPGRGSAPGPERLGGKGHHLARLAALAGERFTVPRFVVIETGAFDECVSSGRRWPSDESEANARARETAAAKIPEALRIEVATALASAGLENALLAVRSSASAEDSAARSFAGQFDSILGVAGGAGPLWDAVRRVWASAFNARAAAYGGDPATGVRMAVVIQEMVDPQVSGVAFSVDPVSGDRHTAVVSAVYGVGEGLVSGELDADNYRVRFGSGGPSVAREIAHKPSAVRLAASGGTRLEPVEEPLHDAAALDDEQAIAVARAACAIADASGTPQDVEWAIAGSPPRLVILQARPVTAAAPASTPATAPLTGERRVWDNSNIIESYSGVTTPLTFSFASEVYESVYRQFCRVLGTPEPLLASHAGVFANMLGLARGRVYYNLLNWYRTLALLPGFQFNRSFMERMMGVREALEDPPPPPSTGSRLRDLWSLVRMVVRITLEARKLKREVPAFQARVERALGPLRREPIETWPADQALALYHRLERELLEEWRPPLVNDFFAMVFFGVLGRLTERWLPDAPPTLVNDLLCGEGGIISTEPARRVMALASLARATPVVAAALASEPDDRALLARIEPEPAAAEFNAALNAYLDTFGDRCMEELKLETVTLREDPTFLLGMIRAYAAQGTVDPEAAWQREREIRRGAEERVDARLRGIRRWVHRWVLERARWRVRDRENLRFERTRVFGVVRRIFVALGRHLAESGRLRAPRDVFYLTRAELFAAAEGAGPPQDLAGLVAERRARFEAYARGPAPPDRFETRGASEGVLDDAVVPAASVGTGVAGGELRGTGCCPGVVRAAVRVVRDPRQARDLEGRILVAERTDPGWTLLFPAVRGLLVQRGSLLSHSAIVAREMGLPCVVGIAGLLETLRDGEEVEMDGTTGMVRRFAEGTP
jgi:phosphohistidine swiveling domain-containing protein